MEMNFLINFQHLGVSRISLTVKTHHLSTHPQTWRVKRHFTVGSCMSYRNNRNGMEWNEELVTNHVHHLCCTLGYVNKGGDGKKNSQSSENYVNGSEEVCPCHVNILLPLSPHSHHWK